MDPLDFESSASATAEVLRSAVDRLLESFGCPGRTPTDIHRATSLNMKLSWKLSRLITAPSPLAGAIHIPGRSNQLALLEQARRTDVPEALREELRESFDRFEEHVRVEAGDRRSYDSLVSVYSADREGIMRDHRRSAFRANRHIWGLEADVQVKTVIASITRDDPDRLDLATISSSQRIRRIRPTKAPLFLMTSGIVNEDGTSRPLDAREPWVMREFTSPDVRDLEVDPVASEWRVTVPAQHLGLRNATTVTVGVVFPSCTPRHAVPSVPAVGPTTGVHCPTPLLVLDCLVDRRVFREASASPTCRANFYADRLASDGRPDAPDARETNVVMANVPVSSLGDGLAAANLPEVPSYRPMLSEVLGRIDADPDGFLVFRVRVEYPILLSFGRLDVNLPRRDGVDGPA